jgi:hypothetical protein
VAIYTYLTQAQLKQQISNRLYDPSQQQWNSAELGFYIAEALRTWNALTSFWRGDFVGSTSQNVVFYDLTNATTFPNTLRPITLHDTDLYSLLQVSILEPVAWNPWTGVSTQFTADDVLNAVQRRQNEILSVSGSTITRRTIGAVAGRIQLPDTVIDVRRIAYLPNSPGTNSVLFQDDTWAEQAFNPGYTTQPPGTPFTYLLNTQPPISFDTDRAPGFSGNYEILTIENGAFLSVGTPSLLSIPDDWSWAIKWGALADLLSRDANPKDTLRASYCEQRYRMAVSLLTDAPALLAARINGTPAQIDAVKNADLFNPTWEAQAQTQPNMVLTAGLNLIAMSPTPSAGPFGLAFTVVQNAPIPANDAANVQVAREDLDAIISYCCHLALFKTGGAEFQDSLPLLEQFLRQASLYNSKLLEWGEFSKILREVSSQEEDFNPRMAPAEVQNG